LTIIKNLALYEPQNRSNIKITKMNIKHVLTVLLIFTVAATTFARSWREIKSTEELCKTYPETMQIMLKQYNLDYPGLEKVKAASESGNLVEACNELLNYYRYGNTAKYLRRQQPAESDKTVAEADTTLKNVFIVQNVRGEVPWLDDGHRDWYYKGPNNDREWAWLSNRHSQLYRVFDYYFETGNPNFYEILLLKVCHIRQKKVANQFGGVWKWLQGLKFGRVYFMVF